MHCPELAREEIERLRADGIEPDLDELAEIIELARRVECPPHRTNPLASRAPVAVGIGGPLLWPITLQAQAWLDMHPAQLGQFGAAMVGYAAAVGRERGAFDALHTWTAIASAVSHWRDSLACTRDELENAARILVGDNEPEDAPGDPDAKACMADLLAEVATETCQSVEYWLEKSSPEFISAVRAVAHKRAAAQGGEIGDSNEDAARMRAFQWSVERVRRRASNGQE